MKKQTILMLIVAVLMLLSCSTPEQIQQRKCEKAQKKYELKAYKLGCPWQIYDSITILKTVTETRDTTIFVHLPGDTVRDSIPYQPNTPINTLETKYAISKAWIANNVLNHTLVQKQSNIPTTLPGVIQTTIATKEKIIKVPYPVDRPVKMPLSWIEKFLMWSGAIAWGLLIAFVLYKFKRFITFPRWFK